MSAAAGFSYSGERFEKHFADFRKKYGFSDMYSGGFYPYETLEEYWAQSILYTGRLWTLAMFQSLPQ